MSVSTANIDRAPAPELSLASFGANQHQFTVDRAPAPELSLASFGANQHQFTVDRAPAPELSFASFGANQRQFDLSAHQHTPTAAYAGAKELSVADFQPHSSSSLASAYFARDETNDNFDFAPSAEDSSHVQTFFGPEDKRVVDRAFAVYVFPFSFFDIISLFDLLQKLFISNEQTQSWTNCFCRTNFGASVV